MRFYSPISLFHDLTTIFAVDRHCFSSLACIIEASGMSSATRSYSHRPFRWIVCPTKARMYDWTIFMSFRDVIRKLLLYCIFCAVTSTQAVSRTRTSMARTSRSSVTSTMYNSWCDTIRKVGQLTRLSRSYNEKRWNCHSVYLGHVTRNAEIVIQFIYVMWRETLILSFSLSRSHDEKRWNCHSVYLGHVTRNAEIVIQFI